MYKAILEITQKTHIVELIYAICFIIRHKQDILNVAHFSLLSGNLSQLVTLLSSGRNWLPERSYQLIFVQLRDGSCLIILDCDIIVSCQNIHSIVVIGHMLICPCIFFFWLAGSTPFSHWLQERQFFLA